MLSPLITILLEKAAMSQLHPSCMTRKLGGQENAAIELALYTVCPVGMELYIVQRRLLQYALCLAVRLRRSWQNFARNVGVGSAAVWFESKGVGCTPH